MTTVNPESAAIKLEDLSFAFAPSAPPVLTIPAWHVERGEQVFLQGESGSGKSTLLSLLAGLQRPTQGSVDVLGTRISSLGARQRDKFRAQNLGVVFQQFNLIPYLSVLENVMLAAQFGESMGAGTRQRAVQLLTRVNLPAALHSRKARELSIGQQQRVAIVRALINQPALLLVDEPTSALDHGNRDAFLELLFDVVADSSCAMVFVSHDPTLGHLFNRRVSLAAINHLGGQS